MIEARILEKVIDRRIIRVDRLDKASMEKMGWHRNPPVLVLDDGTRLVVACDPEGNDGGALWVEPLRGKGGQL